MDYLNGYPLIFYYSDFSQLYNRCHYLDAPRNRKLFSDEYLDDSVEWVKNNIDIENECTGDTSIHNYLKNKIAADNHPFSYYDHGSGD